MILRDALLELSFVKERADGTLDMWALDATNDRDRDVGYGRHLAARFVHLMREFDAPFLLNHVSARWRSLPLDGPTRHIQEGFLREVAAIVIAAPEQAFSGLVGYAVRNASDRDDPASLPMVSRSPDGRLVYWDVQSTGRASEDQALGRFFAARVASHLRRTRDEGFLRRTRADSHRSGSGADAISVGFNQLIGEFVISADSGATLHLEATWPLHRERVQRPLYAA